MEPMKNWILHLNEDGNAESRRLLEKYLDGTELFMLESTNRDSTSRIERILDIIEALWSMQALRERHFHSWVSLVIKSGEEKEATLRKAYDLEAKQKGLKSAQDNVLVLYYSSNIHKNICIYLTRFIVASNQVI
jgi:hypothetical protein